MNQVRDCVWIVEDDPAMSTALAAIVESMGHSTVTMTSADQCREKLGRQRPDCLIIDYGLPGESGIEFCQSLQSIVDDPPPVVLISGHQQSDIQHLGDLNLVVSFLEKPFALHAIQRDIETALAAGRKSEPHSP